jgi:hypothetical protein
MRFPTRYLGKLKADPRPKLFGYKSPGAVRARALKLLEDRSDDDFLMRHALRDARDYPPRKEIIADWHENGGWGSDRFYMHRWGEAAARDKVLVTATRNLALLSLYAWRPGEDESEVDYLDEAAELILKRAGADGGLRFISPENNRAAEEGVRWIEANEHWPGIAVAALLELGVEGQRLERYLDFLERNQRPDGGWLTGSEAAQDRPSHPLLTANYALSLCAHPQRRSGEAARRAARFLLDNAFKTVGDHRLAGAALWERPALPQWGFDALKALKIALDAGFGPNDAGVMRIVEWLIGEQESSGLWHTTRRQPVPDEDLFLTLKATAVMKRIYDDLATEA